MRRIIDDNTTFRTEDKLTKHVKDYLKTLEPRGLFYKASDRYKPGISDFVGCYRGYFVAFELKAECNTPTMHQAKFLADVIIAGGCSALVYCLADVKNVIKQIDDVLDKNDIH